MNKNINLNTFGLTNIYHQYDQIIQTELDEFHKNDIHVSCIPGCHVCCDMSVNLSLIEALAIRRVIPEQLHQQAVDKGKRVLDFARKHRPSDNDLYFYKFRKELGFCSFLNKEKRCKIYEARSLSCRGLYSGLAPDFCRYDLNLIKSKDEIDEAVAALDQDIFGKTPYLHPLLAAGDSFGRLIKEHSMRELGFHLEGEMHFLLSLLQSESFNQALKQKKPRIIKEFLETRNFPSRILKIH